MQKDKIIKDTTIREIRTLSESDEDYYKPVRIGNDFSNSYIEHESDNDKNKTLSIKEDLEEIMP